MKMKTCSIVLMVLFMLAPAMADVTLMFGDEFGGVDLTLPRFGPNGMVEAGAIVATAYDLDTSNGIDDWDMDFGDAYEGLSVKIHALPEDSAWDPFVGYAYLLREAELDDEYEVFEIGIMYNPVGIGLSYVHCDEFVKDDQWMIRFRAIRFK